MFNLNHPIHVVGVSLITSNEEAFSKNTIGKLWEKFLNSPIKEKVNNISSSKVYAVYSDYENEHHGKYKITIGFAVDALNDIPSELSVATISKGKFKQFKSKSQSPEDIIDTWKLIWGADTNSLQRNYVTDFEEYSDNEMSIYIGCQ